MTTPSQATFAPPEPAAVVERYGRLVSSICWRMTRDEDAAREAAQEVWLAVLEGLPRFRGESSLSTWIYTCLLYTSPSPRDRQKSRMPSSA